MPREQYLDDSSTPNFDNLDKNNGSEENKKVFLVHDAVNPEKQNDLSMDKNV